MIHVTNTMFIFLCLSAPWISRRWGLKGEMAWGTVAFVFLVSCILFLD